MILIIAAGLTSLQIRRSQYSDTNNDHGQTQKTRAAARCLQIKMENHVQSSYQTIWQIRYQFKERATLSKLYREETAHRQTSPLNRRDRQTCRSRESTADFLRFQGANPQSFLLMLLEKSGLCLCLTTKHNNYNKQQGGSLFNRTTIDRPLQL